jgi:hypothetical protein
MVGRLGLLHLASDRCSLRSYLNRKVDSPWAVDGLFGCRLFESILHVNLITTMGCSSCGRRHREPTGVSVVAATIEHCSLIVQYLCWTDRRTSIVLVCASIRRTGSMMHSCRWQERPFAASHLQCHLCCYQMKQYHDPCVPPVRCKNSCNMRRSNCFESYLLLRTQSDYQKAAFFDNFS